MEYDVDCPDCGIRDEHLSPTSQNIPEQQKVQRNRRGDHQPNRRTHTLHAVTGEADKASDRERFEDVRFLVDQVHAESPGERGEEDRDVKQDGRRQRVQDVPSYLRLSVLGSG